MFSLVPLPPLLTPEVKFAFFPNPILIWDKYLLKVDVQIGFTIMFADKYENS